ncbi:uncharacterized protein NECHADRAFT_84227 [Fusarium vanettenii 77-13-4]|uniref:NACHT domain-containing protein n=1 Tax=Fusarium vanettenii (strain ATCC MYA-4622 / CBS 123669 / FGSC 9596 / NRRL 45880 / 77-13-4) TaxID=660122 RepID=C7Z026_FUSV7|nr:uncharacterized protein NECHADRAFT_84227 [Fusarium vanettenii 77-13-4]EEU42897.1 predicted protein [Fusarium vanettenii 77-13-4]
MRRILCCGISRLGDGSDDQPGRPVGLNPSASQQHSSVSKPVGPVVSNGIAAPPSLGTSPTTEPSVEKQVKPNLWDEARGRLSEEDKAWINGNSQQFLDSSGPGVRGIIDLVDQKRRQCEARRWTNVDVFDTTINLSDLASNAITWLNKFKEVGDTIVQYDPGHAALPWAATRFILQSAISYQEHMAFSLISVEKTTRIVHRCQIYEMLYNCDTANAQAASGLEQALVELYASLLHVLARVGKFLSKDTAWRSIHAVFRPTEGTDLLSELEKFENEVIKEATVCESKRSAKADSKTEEQLQKLQSLLKLEGRMLRVDENVQKALESIELKELIKVLTWISPIEYNLHHDLSETSSITFWLQGFAGSGKTFLTSRVIDLIAENLGSKRNHEGFAFFYCNQTEPTRRQALSVLCSFIRQLSSPKCMSDHLHPKLRQLYFDSQLKGAGWTLDLCKEYLIDLFNFYPHTTVILDALDECEVEERILLLNIFDWATKSSSRPVKIFVSSRPEADIRQRLISLPNLEISAKNNNDDISRFIKESADSPGPWSPVLEKNKALKNEIVQTLIKKSDGMFQWARLQVDQLRVLEHENDLRDRLGRLPKDLKSSYDEIYQRIQDRPEYSRVRTLRALKWVTASARPLKTKELLAAIRLDPDKEEVDKAGEVTEEQLLGWCANLLIRDKNEYYSIIWRPCHLSVVEYLEDRSTMPTAHLFVTLASLFFLVVQPDKKDPLCSLQPYARKHWMEHVQSYDKASIDFACAPHNRVAAMLKRFLGSPTQRSDAYVQWTQFDDFSSNIDPPFSVCFYPVFYPLRDWWESDDVKVDHLALDHDGEGLLTVAARSGCIPICDNLIKRGIPVNPEKYGTGYESPLAAAAANGQAPMVKFLLERGAHVDLLLKDGHYGSALAAARDANVSQILIDNGADINLMLEAGYYGSALAATRDKDIAQLLVDKGADVNMILKAGGFGSALVSAIAAYADDVVELLVEKGADANLPLLRGRYGSALIAAAYTGNVHIAKLLVKHGADVKYLPPVCSYGSALIAASSIFQSNETLLLQFLIEKGAEVDSIAKSGHFGSALAAAAHSDRPVEQCISVMDLLIENGANVNLAISTGIYGSALRAAVSSRRPSAAVCRYLLKKGADVHLHVPHGCYGSPLIAAMQSGSEEVVKSLLEEGVEVDQIPDGEKVVFGTALIAGAYWGFARGVQMLLEAGALVNLQSKVGRFRTALEAVRADLTNEGGVFKDPLWKWRRALGEGIEEARDRMKLQVEELLITHGATE